MSRRSYHGYEKNEPRTLTVSYRRHDDRLIVSRVGFGRSRDECLQHADEQLPPGPLDADRDLEPLLDPE